MKEFPKQNTDKNSPEYRAFELHRRAFGLIHSFFERQWQESDQTDKKNDFIKRVTKDVATTFGTTIKTELNFNSLTILEEKEDIINKITEIFIELITKHLSLEELEQRFQTRQIEEKGYFPLSRGLNFEIKNNQIILHIPITFFENAEAFLQSFKEGLKLLATKIVNEPQLKNIKEITGYSELVKEKHRLLKKLGFEVILDEKGQPTESTFISREKLLELYGK